MVNEGLCPGDGLVDGHIHVWSADTDRYPWRPVHGASSPAQPGDADWVLDVLERHGARTAVAVQPRAYGNDHAYLADTLGRFPGRLVAVAALDPRDPAAPDQLTDLAAVGFRGLRLDPMGWGSAPLADGTVLPLWDRAAELDLAIELLIRPDQLGALGRREHGRRLRVTPLPERSLDLRPVESRDPRLHVGEEGHAIIGAGRCKRSGGQCSSWRSSRCVGATSRESGSAADNAPLSDPEDTAGG